MKTKIIAAKIAATSGVDTIITNGLKSNLLKDTVSGRQVGTIIKAKKQCLKARKLWIAFSKKSKGTVFVDNKTSEVLLSGNKSLLAVGITEINGNFQMGDTVNIANTKTRKNFARGLANYNSSDLEKIKGKNLGYGKY
ncbi:hypothetical protein AGMMS49921_10660 [Endomicrobiia bacterium]|nr:hypothetical protein AGMMS49921_10660 [Endomicrobiia bacterium]